MSYVLLQTPFVCQGIQAKHYLRKNPSVEFNLKAALRQLAEDPFHPSLKSHRLKGQLASSWACSAGYDLRIIFSFTRQDKAQAILLHTVGTHGEVY